MAEQMRGPATRARHPRSAERSVDDDGDGTVGAKRPKWWTAANKDDVGLRARSTIIDIPDQGLSHFASQRQPRGTTSLSTDVNPGAFPVEIAESKLHDVAGAKAQPCEQ